MKSQVNLLTATLLVIEGIYFRVINVVCSAGVNSIYFEFNLSNLRITHL